MIFKEIKKTVNRYLKPIIFITLFCSGAMARPVTISFLPIADVGSLASPHTVNIRNSVIAELTESYDCVILSRSRGLALYEEQRQHVLNSLDPHLLPYPVSADYLVVPELRNDSKELILRLNYTTVTGGNDGSFKHKVLRFSSAHEFRAKGADEVVAALADSFSLKITEDTSTGKFRDTGKVWAVLPWMDYSNKLPDRGAWSQRLMDEAAGILERELLGAEQIAPEALQASEVTMFPGATEAQAAAVGKDVGADYLLTGAISETDDGLLLYAFVVRSQDAVVLAGREMRLDPEFRLGENFTLLIEEILSGLPESSVMGGSSEAANLEEARLLYEVADNFKWSNGGQLLSFYHSLDLFLAARMVAQDTYYEHVVLRRIPVLIHEHPNTYYFKNNWRTIEQKTYEQDWNDYVLDTLKRTLPRPYEDDELLILSDAYSNNGDWDNALELQNDLIRRGAWEPRSNDRDACDRARALSLSGRFDEAAEFYESVPGEVRGVFLYQQAAMNFRRIGDDERELAVMVEMLEEGEWQTYFAEWRFCALSEKYHEPSEQLRLAKLFEKTFRSKARVQWHMIQAELELGMEEAAARRASLLLGRTKIGRAGFESKNQFRARLEEIAGDYIQKWPKAVSIQKIPAEYKMYIQPVGEFDEKVLNEAVAIASEFFGCEYVIRPGIPAPEGRTAYWGNDMTKYYAVPLLRHLNVVRPAPEDAIAQIYYVDSNFIVVGRGPVDDTYFLGLGTMITPEISFRVFPEEKKVIKSVASEIIRHFRYYIERSHEIWLSESPDNEGCVNAARSSKKDYEFGYCSECAMNYANADMKKVYEFTQAIPLPVAYSKEYRTKYGIRSVHNQAEKNDIEAYFERVGKE